jgi:hypothetical protein
MRMDSTSGWRKRGSVAILLPRPQAAEALVSGFLDVSGPDVQFCEAVHAD